MISSIFKCKETYKYESYELLVDFFTQLYKCNGINKDSFIKKFDPLYFSYYCYGIFIFHLYVKENYIDDRVVNHFFKCDKNKTLDVILIKNILKHRNILELSNFKNHTPETYCKISRVSNKAVYRYSIEHFKKWATN